MAWVIQMSDRELTRLRVMIDLADDRLTVDAAATLRPELANWPCGTHKGTERERGACRKTLAARYPYTFPI
jgi:hypothetical protein